MPPACRLRPLTDAERAFAAEHLKLAYHFAWKCRDSMARFGRAEVLSAAHLGLCEAAATFNPACGGWPSWVGLCVRRHVARLWDDARREKRRRFKTVPSLDADGGSPIDRAADPHPPGSDAVDAADAVRWVRRQLARLPAPEARAVADYCLAADPPTLAAVGRRHGCSRQRVQQRVAAATERLRRAA